MSDQSTEMEIKCLDHGFVRLVDYMGSDSRIVDAARVSYQQGTKAVQSDRHLIRYLVRNHHTTPLEKVVLEFHVKLPIFVARQWMRHRTGSFNEISARYSIMKDEFYIPEEGMFRKQSTSNRQGSSDESISEELPSGDTPTELVTEQVQSAYKAYQDLLTVGGARELSRAVLPVSLYTEFYWTVNLWNLFHFLRLRLDGHAQLEVRVFAEAIKSLLDSIDELKFVMEAFQDYILDAPNITKYELGIVKDLISQLTAQGAPESYQKDEIKQRLQTLLDNHPDMSKREKTETRIFELILD